MNFNNRTIVVVMMLLIVTGCSSMGQLQIRTPQPLTPEGLPADELGWWQARFHILWGPDETPSWNVDLILAHQIVLPVLQQHQDAIVLWRFHRRAARDEFGLTEAVYDDPSVVTQPNIEDAADRHWSDVVRRTWPYYIMGVSRMWLSMIAEIAVRQPAGDHFSTVSELMAFYQEVNTTLSEVWRKEGRHAFLHHLNALFGYEPLIYYEKRMLTF
jgi:hypothetical protein